MSAENPIFAVVGKVNKGKSSILATLAEEPQVEISPLPRTTTQCQDFKVFADGRLLYTLIDTPGFQQAREVLAWLKEHEDPKKSRREVILEFLKAHEGGDEFLDERELLAPILRGTGILYVVDGSRPFRAPFRAEMEILRRTGQPRMALINSIGRADHGARWREELDQYFSIVRPFDAHKVRFVERLRLLRGMRELRDDWRGALDESINFLKGEWRRRRKVIGRSLVKLLLKSLSLVLEEQVAEAPQEELSQTLSVRFHDALRKIELTSRREVEACYGHHDLKRQEEALSPPVWERDLFAASSWKLLGLNSRQLIWAGAAAGATAGGTVDLFVGGAAFFAGALIGGLGGAATSLHYASKRLVSPKQVLRSLQGQRLMRIGPHKNPNFPWIVLDRALLHWLAVRDWAHARQDALELVYQAENRGPISLLTSEEHKQMLSLFSQIQRQPNKVREQHSAKLEALILDLMERLSEEEEEALSRI